MIMNDESNQIDIMTMIALIIIIMIMAGIFFGRYDNGDPHDDDEDGQDHVMLVLVIIIMIMANQ